MKLHLAVERTFILARDEMLTRLVVYFEDEPRHAAFLDLVEPYTLEALIEGLGKLQEKLKESL